MSTIDTTLADDIHMKTISSNESLWTQLNEWRYFFFKRTIDVVGSVTGLVLLAPIFIVIAILIKSTSKGAVLYTQERVGKDGKLFKIYKFRTMYMYEIDGKPSHADKLLEIHSGLKTVYQNNSYKIQNDPRITPIGLFLRKTSLDELPQLVNVVLGHMSLVGPRAFQEQELFHQQQVYPHTMPWVHLSLQIKPGASGPWQVSGRSQINFDKRVALDAQYATRRSILYDLWIIFKTPIVMFTGKGAC